MDQLATAAAARRVLIDHVVDALIEDSRKREIEGAAKIANDAKQQKVKKEKGVGATDVHLAPHSLPHES